MSDNHFCALCGFEREAAELTSGGPCSWCLKAIGGHRGALSLVGQSLRDPEAKEALARRISMVGDPCHYCGERKPLASMEYDHVRPLYGGGREAADNLVRACLSCNRRKGARDKTEAGLPVPSRLSVARFRARLTDVLAAVSDGQEVTVLRYGRPVARLKPYSNIKEAR